MNLEGLLERAIAMVPGAELATAREEFSARAGAFEPNEPFYEERIRAFFDLYDTSVQLGVLPPHGGIGEKAMMLLRGFGLRARS